MNEREDENIHKNGKILNFEGGGERKLLRNIGETVKTVLGAFKKIIDKKRKK